MESILNKLQIVLDEAIEDSSENFDDFLHHKIFKLGKFIGLYGELLRDIEDLEDEILYKKHENFLADWDRFLNEIEKKSKVNQSFESILHTGVMPIDVRETADYFVELNRQCNKSSSFKDICSRIGKKYLVLVLLRHFA
jgi:hypothetical protein